MGKVIRSYETDFSRSISEDLKRRIKSDSGGHASSLMALLKLHDKSRPTLRDWSLAFEQQYRKCMNGMRFKIEEDLAGNPDLRRLVKTLSGYGFSKWEEDIDGVIKQQRRGSTVRLGTLLNIGILSVFDFNMVGFTSKLIYSACIDVLFPRRRIRLQIDEVEDPLQLFETALRHYPDILTNRDAWNKDDPAEVIFQWELYAAFRDLVPRGWSCLGEIRESQGGQKRLDLMVYGDGRKKWAGFELKVNNVEGSKIEESIDQAMGYLEDHTVDIYLLNFCLDSKKLPPAPISRWSTRDKAHRVIVVNISHTAKCDEFDVVSEGKSWRTKVDKSPPGSPKSRIKRAYDDGDEAIDRSSHVDAMDIDGTTARELGAIDIQQTEQFTRKHSYDGCGTVVGSLSKKSKRLQALEGQVDKSYDTRSNRKKKVNLKVSTRKRR
jgi:hypothetical protein